MLALAAALVLSQTGTVQGEVVVVPDSSGSGHMTSNLVAGLGSTLCAFGARGLYAVKPDVFDAVVVFTNNPLTGSALTGAATPKGTLVRATSTGSGYGSPLIVLQPSEYGSAARLTHCVYLGPVQNLPAQPDDDFLLPMFGGGTSPSGTTGVEVLGHEFGHQWMAGSAFDQGQGLDVLHRADDRQPLMGTQTSRVSAATLHYSHLADSRSVMYGNFITDLGGGSYRLAGGPRGYGPMDQYFMGLRAPQDTPPLLVLDDGSGMGLIGTPLRRGETQTVTGMSAVNVSVDDFIRAQGARAPAFPQAKRCFRVAFVLVTQQGTTASVDQLALVDRYRQRWESWFGPATDGRGNTVTTLDVFADCPEPSLGADAGVDAGVAPEMDAGVDAGADVVVDAGAPASDAGSGDDGRIDTGKIRPGCGCGGGADLALLCLVVLPLLPRRRGSG
ncbi:MAG: hypothetical protein U0228_33410 [Myxococcaceae bacterium]